MNLQENKDVNIENFSITTAIHEAAFEALGQREKNNRMNQEWWNDELKALQEYSSQMRFLRSLSGVTLRNKTKNEEIRKK